MTDETVVIVDGENVRRSAWPNVSRDDLVALVARWAARTDVRPIVVFDGDAPDGAVGSGSESADDWIAREARRLPRVWLVTSDRELRKRAGRTAARVVGGGSFLRELRAVAAEDSGPSGR